MSDLLYLYGIIPPTDHIPFITGIDDQHLLQFHLKYQMAVVFSVIDSDQITAEKDELALMGYIIQHDAIVNQLSTHFTIVPIAFGTIVRGEDALGALIAQNAPRWQQTLERVKDCVEISVNAYVQEPVLRAQFDQQSEQNTPVVAANYLLKKKQERDLHQSAQAHATHVLVTLHDTLSAHAKHALIRPITEADHTELGRLMLQAVYLIPRQHVPAFQAALQAQTAPEGDWLTIEVSSPYAPYHFLDADSTPTAAPQDVTDEQPSSSGDHS